MKKFFQNVDKALGLFYTYFFKIINSLKKLLKLTNKNLGMNLVGIQKFEQENFKRLNIDITEKEKNWKSYTLNVFC